MTSSSAALVPPLSIETLSPSEPRPASASRPRAGSGTNAHDVAALYRTHGPMVYRCCLRYLRDRTAARDATQEVFVKLVRDLPRLEDRPSLLPWMYRVARNHCLNLLRDERSRGEEQLEPVAELPSRSPGEEHAQRALARDLLAQFDAPTQAIALGVLVEGMDQTEVSAALGCSRRTVERKLVRFQARARRYLALSGVTGLAG